MEIEYKNIQDALSIALIANAKTNVIIRHLEKVGIVENGGLLSEITEELKDAFAPFITDPKKLEVFLEGLDY